MEDGIKPTDSQWKHTYRRCSLQKGVLQGDYLSVILFILSLNPSSFLLNETEGYKMGPSKDRNKNLTHFIFCG